MSFDVDLPDQDYIPEPDKRTWYRHETSGERAFFVRVEGMDQIQLDRPNEVIRRPFIPGEWNVEEEYRPLTLAQVGKACFVVDKEMLAARGMHELARRDWHGLSDEQRIKWMNRGPVDDPLRAELWKAVMGVIRPLAR